MDGPAGLQADPPRRLTLSLERSSFLRVGSGGGRA
jgi:hypothetical protein